MVTAGIHHISDSVFLSAAEALADLVTEDDLKVGRMYPPLATLRNCSLKIAAKVAEDAYGDNTVSRCCVTFTKFLIMIFLFILISFSGWQASTYPEPKDKEEFIKMQLYDYEYDGVSALPVQYAWPAEVTGRETSPK